MFGTSLLFWEVLTFLILTALFIWLFYRPIRSQARRYRHTIEQRGTSSTNVEAQHRIAYARDVVVTEDMLIVDLSDGRSVSAPLVLYPRLMHGTQSERSDWRLIGGGAGIYWPALDEDVSVENLLLGRASGESQRSLERWLSQRAPSGSDDS